MNETLVFLVSGVIATTDIPDTYGVFTKTGATKARMKRQRLAKRHPLSYINLLHVRERIRNPLL